MYITAPGRSTAYGDELAWAAAWLYRATSSASYLTAAEAHYNYFNLHRVAWAFSWDDKDAGVQVGSDLIAVNGLLLVNQFTFA